jgi:Mg2+ and Co2+ transporter CorA
MNKPKIEFREIRMHLSRKATMEEDGYDEGLTYTEEKEKAVDVCVWYDVSYKDGEVIMIDEKDFHIDEYGTIDKAQKEAENYAYKLAKKYKTYVNYY